MTDIVKTLEDALAIIKKQKAEIKRLKKEQQQFADIGKMYSEVRAEAVNEFAERLKEDIANDRLENFMNGLKGTPMPKVLTYDCIEDYIDNLVKEMKEVSE